MAQRAATCRAAFAAALAACALVTGPAPAQTVRPVVAEYVRKGVGRFEVANPSLFPVDVVLEPQSFDIDEDGRMIYRPLDAGIRLELSAMSFRIPPRQQRVILYEVQADSLPAWFSIYAQFTGPPLQAGLDLKVELPHTILIYDGRNASKTDVRIVDAQFDSIGAGVRVRIENAGPQLQRITSAVLQGGGVESQFASSVPLLPGRTRTFVIPWKAAVPPRAVLIRGEKFSIERDLFIATR